MDKGLYITELIDVETLQTMQEAFSKLTGIAALITDEKGVLVTKGTNCTDFCMKHIRQSELGKLRCEQCAREGTEQAVEKKKSFVYTCHAGLTNFAAPIMVGNQLVGSFIGGQVLAEPVDETKIRELIAELSADEVDCIEAIKHVHVVSQENVSRAEECLSTFADVLSHMAYSRHVINEGNQELEKVARMKSDFLANMSHEIRTPMNAVIGMAELALREEMPPVARDYVNQIMSSGKTLLTIINDILDFSKIDSGKMDIIAAEYDPFAMLNEILTIIMTRIGTKDVELLIDVPPDLPKMLYGDVIRIKQIITNLANNAVKFTEKGKVHLKLWYEKLDEENIMLYGAVEDTGMGIKKNDLDKLFQSFQQVDSKRNRNIEGTGLGLAISKQLLLLMDGEIHVESEYGKGSVFSFSLPQKVVDWQPKVAVQKQGYKVAAFIKNPYIIGQLKQDIERFGAEFVGISSAQDLQKLSDIENVKFLFVDMKVFSEQIERYLSAHSETVGVLLTDYHSMMEYSISNLRVEKKPIYSYSIGCILEGLERHDTKNNAFEDFTFIAPDARVLIVDDNEVNLTVAKGLLKPLKMKIETATSGKDAVYKISAKMYDLIFMDHMMPEIDGIEATRIIRRLHPEYAAVPIIALTANVVDGTREMFIEEEMNDLVAKPIDVKEITAKVRQWLPQDKIVRLEDDDPNGEQSIDLSGIMVSPDGKKLIMNPDIEKVSQQNEMEEEKEQDKVTQQEEEIPKPSLVEGLDTDSAIKRLGTEELFWEVLKDYYHSIERKAKQIKQLEKAEQWNEYTIEVHALKSASRQIGAMELGKLAEELEMAGKAGDIDVIQKKTNKMLAQYLQYQMILQPYFPEEEKKEGSIEVDVLKMHLLNLKNAASEIDVDMMDAIISEMSQYDFEGKESERFAALQTAVEELDAETCTEIVDIWCEDLL